MADNKKSFILHIDSLIILDELTAEEAGKLFFAIRDFQLGKELDLDKFTRVIFTPFKNQFIRDNEKFNEFIVKQQINGSKGGRPKTQHNPNKPKPFSENPTKPKKPYNDNDSINVSIKDNINVNVNNNVNDNIIKGVFNFKNSLIELGFEKNLIEDWLKVRKLKKLTNTETAFQAVKKEVESTNININDILKLHVEKSWGGFKVDWFKNEKNVAPVQQKPKFELPMEKSLRILRERQEQKNTENQKLIG